MVTVPSGAPLNVRAEPLTSTSVRLSWQSPRNDTWNGNLLGYRVGILVKLAIFVCMFTSLFYSSYFAYIYRCCMVRIIVRCTGRVERVVWSLHRVQWTLHRSYLLWTRWKYTQCTPLCCVLSTTLATAPTYRSQSVFRRWKEVRFYVIFCATLCGVVYIVLTYSLFDLYKTLLCSQYLMHQLASQL